MLLSSAPCHLGLASAHLLCEILASASETRMSTLSLYLAHLAIKGTFAYRMAKCASCEAIGNTLHYLMASAPHLWRVRTYCAKSLRVAQGPLTSSGYG